MLVAQSMATRLGEGRKAQIITFGCQMNERDAETMRGLLVHMGYTMTDRTDEADLILFNTCSVRENPERKVYGRVGLLKELKAKKPWLKIGICGCMPQQRAEREQIAETLPHVDLVFGTMNIHQLPELLQRVEAGERVIEVWHEEGDVVEGLPVQRLNPFKAFVTVIYGCNEHCTYCIVPTTRGRERSRRPEAILAEIRELAARGTGRSPSWARPSTPTVTTWAMWTLPASSTRSTGSGGSGGSASPPPTPSTSPPG